MGVFCDRLKLGSTAALHCTAWLAKTKADIAKKSLYSYSSRWLYLLQIFGAEQFKLAHLDDSVSFLAVSLISSGIWRGGRWYFAQKNLSSLFSGHEF